MTTYPPDSPATVPPNNAAPLPDNDVPQLNTPNVEDVCTTHTLTEKVVKNMKVIDLKSELTTRGLSRQGPKEILLEHLLSAI